MNERDPLGPKTRGREDFSRTSDICQDRRRSRRRSRELLRRRLRLSHRRAFWRHS